MWRLWSLRDPGATDPGQASGLTDEGCSALCVQPGDRRDPPAAAVAAMREEALRIGDRAQVAAVDVGGIHARGGKAPARERRQVGPPVAFAGRRERGFRAGVLDHERSESIVRLLAEVTREFSVATVMVTHDTEFIALTDSVATMRDGVLGAAETVAA